MTFTSYPPTGVDFTSTQWSTYQDRADGILAEAPGTFTLSLSSSTDVCTVVMNTGSVGERSRVRLGGFVGEMTSNTNLTLAAAVGSPVTYHVGFKYDPAQHANANGPVSLVSFTGNFDESAGARYLGLWDVTRSPSQTLNLAATVDRRLFVRHTIEVNNTAAIPAASRCLGFTEARCFDTGNVWQVQFTGVSSARQWVQLNHPDPVAFPLNSPLQGVGGEDVANYVIDDDSWLTAAGSLMRTTGTLNTGSDVNLGTFPVGARPLHRKRFIVASFTSSGSRAVMVYVDATGVTWLADSSITAGVTVSQLNLEGIRFRAEQ